MVASVLLAIAHYTDTHTRTHVLPIPAASDQCTAALSPLEVLNRQAPGPLHLIYIAGTPDANDRLVILQCAYFRAVLTEHRFKMLRHFDGSNKILTGHYSRGIYCKLFC